MSTANKLFQAASGGAGESVYVEDVFSTYLYTGNSSTKVITNGIDLAGKGGLVWGKSRDNAFSHMLVDTERGGDKGLSSNASSAEYDNSAMITSFNSNGFTLGSYLGLNYSGDNVASFSFRKQAGFFDVVTYTGDGTSSRDIAHNLGSKPGFIITKRTNLAGNWTCYHQALGYEERIYLDLTNAKSTNSATWVQEPTATHFTVGSENTSGSTYVAYLFAHDDQSFGDNSDEAIIKCGSYTGNGSSTGPEVTLGFEPQWLMIKGVGDSDWIMLDIMRGIPTGSNDARLRANVNGAETSTIDFLSITSTGFNVATNNSNVNTNGTVYTYIAIRRPMKKPVSGTEVFSVSDSMSGGTQPAFNAPHVCDMAFMRRPAFTQTTHIASRLTGTKNLYTDTNAAEVNQVENVWDFMDGWGGWTVTNTDYRAWNFKRATGFFDVVAYTGNATNGRTVTHNLGVAPEIIISKRRSSSDSWLVGANFTGSTYDYLNLHTTSAANNNAYAFRYKSQPTATSYTIDQDNAINGSGETYIAYLFATLAGVSKVGSVVHSGTTNVDCGFSAGARFVMVKRTDATGDWYFWDSERGIVAGNDPYLLLNSTAAEVTNTDYIDPLSSGFTLTSSFTAGTYIFLAIA